VCLARVLPVLPQLNDCFIVKKRKPSFDHFNGFIASELNIIVVFFDLKCRPGRVVDMPRFLLQKSTPLVQD
jgi:hypothetical protein